MPDLFEQRSVGNLPCASHRDELRGSFKSLLSLSLAEGIVVSGTRSLVVVEILLTRCPLTKISLAVLLDRMTAMAAQGGTRIERALVERVADVKSLLGRHVPHAATSTEAHSRSDRVYTVP